MTDRIDDGVGVIPPAGRLVVAGQIQGDRLLPSCTKLGHHQMPVPRAPTTAVDLRDVATIRKRSGERCRDGPAEPRLQLAMPATVYAELHKPQSRLRYQRGVQLVQLRQDPRREVKRRTSNGPRWRSRAPGS